MASAGESDATPSAVVVTGVLAAVSGFLIGGVVFGLGALIGPVSADAAFTAGSGVGAIVGAGVGRFAWRHYFGPNS